MGNTPASRRCPRCEQGAPTDVGGHTLPANRAGYPNSELDQDHSEDAGFNRIDLLTVFAGLALLCLVLTPALARTRVIDQGLQCRNNLRQLIQGWQMYADENVGTLPNCFTWVYGSMSYSASDADNTNINYLLNGSLGPYVTDPALYKCPADMSRAYTRTSSVPRVRSVSMSQALCPSNEGALEAANSPPNYWRHYQKSADIVLPAPANLWVIIDEHPDSINDGAFAVAMAGNNPSSDRWQEMPSILHDGGCGITFADGHAEIHKWEDSRTLALKVAYNNFPYGITSPNNNDIQWVKDRTTAPK